MEFIFGNDGKKYGLLYESGDKNASINELVQNVTKYDVNKGTTLYAYKTFPAGKTIKVIFNMCAKDEAFKRKSYYNHVKWFEGDREFYKLPQFFEMMMGRFAHQEDINALRETGELNIAAVDKGVTYDVKEMINSNAMCALLHALYSGADKKIVLPLDLAENFTYNARLLMQKLFLQLGITLRISTSFVVTEDLESFKGSEYKLCVIPSSVLGEVNDRNLLVIRHDEAAFTKNDDWAVYVKWLESKTISERTMFFKEYEEKIGKTELVVGKKMLEFYAEWEENSKKEKAKPKSAAKPAAKPAVKADEPAAEKKPTPYKKHNPASRTAENTKSFGYVEVDSEQAMFAAKLVSAIVDVHIEPQTQDTAAKPAGKTPPVKAYRPEPIDAEQSHGTPPADEPVFGGYTPHEIIPPTGAPLTWSTLWQPYYSWYIGDCVGNVKHGWGTLFLMDGNVWMTGEWINNIWVRGVAIMPVAIHGKPHERHMFQHPDGYMYTGDLENNYPHGRGTVMFRDGTVYTGEFNGKDDKRNGMGVRINRNGYIDFGKWKNGDPFTPECKHAHPYHFIHP